MGTDAKLAAPAVCRRPASASECTTTAAATTMAGAFYEIRCERKRKVCFIADWPASQRGASRAPAPLLFANEMLPTGALAWPRSELLRDRRERYGSAAARRHCPPSRIVVARTLLKPTRPDQQAAGRQAAHCYLFVWPIASTAVQRRRAAVAHHPSPQHPLCAIWSQFACRRRAHANPSRPAGEEGPARARRYLHGCRRWGRAAILREGPLSDADGQSINHNCCRLAGRPSLWRPRGGPSYATCF
jgi:hypothetical protein